MDIAKDIASQVFLKAMSHIKSYQDKGKPFSAWLYRIAYNELMDYFRKNSKHRTINIDDMQVSSLIEGSEVDNSDDNRNKMIMALRQLNKDELMIVEMSYFEKMKYKEISDILGLSVANIKVKMHRIMKKMNKLVSDEL